MSSGIVFQVETTRILQILAREIYDSPLALLRENVQNAYDAIRMRLVPAGRPLSEGRIDIKIDGDIISIKDNGVGMDEDVLGGNFWKAGSSGKQSEEARKAGVVGTFGIGAMANFGVCKQLTVETRAEGSSETLVSVAERDSLKIAEECISLERIADGREIGTTVTATLDPEHRISEDQAKRYLDPYVGILPVPVYLNNALMSGASVEEKLPLAGRSFSPLGSMELSDNLCTASFRVDVDQNGQVLVRVAHLSIGGVSIDGSMVLIQGGGQLMGYKSLLGLAPIPVAGHYQFGGIANLSFLQPTAGREAITRESIEQVTRVIQLAEHASSELLAPTDSADRNNGFLDWIRTHGKYELACRVTVQMLPDDVGVPLGEIASRVGDRTAHYYSGQDKQILATFAGEGACLFHVAQAQPRRAVQLHYLTQLAKVSQVPDSANVTRVYKGNELGYGEAAVIVRIISILRDDYLIADIEASFADISHGVTILPKKTGERLTLYVSKSSQLLPPLLECYDTAWDVFGSFMKDFVRTHVYQRIQQFVPSSTRDGVDALRKLLARNRELYRYEEAELGELKSVLGEYLSGTIGLTEVLRTARTAETAQSQRVSRAQVGIIESVVPDVIESPVAPQTQEGGEFVPCPPIIRDEVESNMKILTTEDAYPQLNSFKMLLGLSDRLVRTEGDFFRTPHTTRILWGGHRVVYIFTEATGRISLYYDIDLHDPIEGGTAGGDMFPTTTLITKKRIFVPVPESLMDAFKITSGPKEFYVRFDTLSSDVKD